MGQEIKYDNFTFTYEGNTSEGVKGIDLTIHKGEFVLFIGSSGCGKTTLTRCINGLIPDFYEGKIEGHCNVCDLDIATHETGDYSSYVGSVFQDPRSQFFTLHVKTEIPFPSENLGVPTNIIQEGFKNTVEQLDIRQLLDKSIFQLSSGEKQKVAIASVYTANVDIYVLDEPSANLDTEGTEQLKKVLEQLKKQGHTVVISEHKLYYLKELIDRVVVLKEGEISDVLSGEEVRRKEADWFWKHGLRQLDLGDVVYEQQKVQENTDVKNSIQIDNLSFGYPNSKLLWRDVSFYCRDGDIVGIVGKNGVGKSSLMRVLMGLEKSKTGKISINNKYASKQKRRQKSFYVMQDVDYQFLAGNVLDEMLMGMKKTKEVYKKANKLLEKFALGHYEKIHPSKLSGGQKQRLAIAVSCMSEFPFLYFDEPTSGLDAKNMKLVSETIKEEVAKGKVAFVITHDYEFAASLFTSLLIVQDDNTIKRIATNEYDHKMLKKIIELEE